MYRLPEDFDGMFFVGRTIEQVCFSQNQLSMHFDHQIVLTIESAFSLGETDSASSNKLQRIPVSNSDLMQLLGFRVTNVRIEEQNTLCLIFQNGKEFRCYDDANDYESYQIRNGAKTIIV